MWHLFPKAFYKKKACFSLKKKKRSEFNADLILFSKEEQSEADGRALRGSLMEPTAVSLGTLHMTLTV